MDTNNIIYMHYLFYDCKELKELPDISKWKTDNVTDMAYIFYGCSTLYA